MSKHEEADLILKLYELRREATMRKARDWFFLNFNPESMDDVNQTFYSEHSGYVRMVTSYWDMAAALVNYGSISIELFTETNGEHFSVFAKVEPFIAELRESFGPQFMVNLEKLIDATPGGRQRTQMFRNRIKTIRARVAEAENKAPAQA